MAFLLVYVQIRGERIPWCATSWCPKGEQGVVVTLPVGLPIIREYRYYGVMCIAVLPQHIMRFSTIILEDQSMLDIDSLFILHCVFFPRINRSLKGFAGAWNHHPLRTE